MLLNVFYMSKKNQLHQNCSTSIKIKQVIIITDNGFRLEDLTKAAAVWAGSIDAQHTVLFTNLPPLTADWCITLQTVIGACVLLSSQSGGSQLEQMEHQPGQNQWGSWVLDSRPTLCLEPPAEQTKQRCRNMNVFRSDDAFLSISLWQESSPCGVTFPPLSTGRSWRSWRQQTHQSTEMSLLSPTHV